MKQCQKCEKNKQTGKILSAFIGFFGVAFSAVSIAAATGVFWLTKTYKPIGFIGAGASVYLICYACDLYQELVKEVKKNE